MVRACDVTPGHVCNFVVNSTHIMSKPPAKASGHRTPGIQYAEEGDVIGASRSCSMDFTTKPSAKGSHELKYKCTDIEKEKDSNDVTVTLQTGQGYYKLSTAMGTTQTLHVDDKSGATYDTTLYPFDKKCAGALQGKYFTKAKGRDGGSFEMTGIYSCQKD